MHTQMKRVIIMSACTLLAATFAGAQVATSWSNPVDGTWDNAANWDNGVPLAGANATLGGNGNYTVDYNTPVAYTIGALTLSNTTGKKTTLNINTSGFKIASGSLANGTINVNQGGVVNCANGLFSASGATLSINGGSWIQANGNIGVATENTTVKLLMNDGYLSLAGNNNMYASMTMTGGVLNVTGSVWNQWFASTISGGTFTNSSLNGFNLRSGTFTISKQGAVVTTYANFMGNGESLQIDGGSFTVTGNKFRIANNTYGATRSSTINQTGGVVSMANAAGLVIGFTTGGTTGGTYLYDLQGGTLNLAKITLTGSARNGGSGTTDQFKMSNGTLNLGAGGIVYGGGAGTQSVLLSGGTVGAQADWSSSMDMTLASTPGPGVVTFRAADTNGTARSITLSGVLSGNGGLTKSGAGTLLLNNANTYTGATKVNAGTLGGTGSLVSTMTVASNAFVTAATPVSVGTLSTKNLILEEGAGVTFNYSTTAQDRVDVTSALTLPTHAVVNVAAVDGAAIADLPAVSTLFTYASASGASNLDEWKINGGGAATVRLDAANKRVLLVRLHGTVILVL